MGVNSTSTEYDSASNSSGRTGGKRGSSEAAATPLRTISAAVLPVTGEMVPIQPRSSPCSCSDTNTPARLSDSSGGRPSGTAMGLPVRTNPSTLARASATYGSTGASFAAASRAPLRSSSRSTAVRTAPSPAEPCTSNAATA